MKKLFSIILLALFIACLSKIANGQNYVHTRSLVIMGDSIRLKRIDLQFRQPTVQLMDMGMSSVYSFPETNIEKGNGVYQKSKVILYQIAMSDSVTVEMMNKIKQAIDLIMFNSPGVPVVVDTVDASASTFTGTWRVGETTAEGWYKNTIAHSNIVGSEATYKDPLPFRRIEIYGERFISHGKIEITIDGGSPKVVDLYNPTKILPFLMADFDVPLGIHEVKIRVLGEKNAASSNYYGLVDFYRIFR